MYLSIFLSRCSFRSIAIYLPTFLSSSLSYLTYRTYRTYRIYRIYLIYLIDLSFLIFLIYLMYLSIDPSIFHIYLPTYLSMDLSIYGSIYLSIYVCILGVSRWSLQGRLTETQLCFGSDFRKLSCMDSAQSQVSAWTCAFFVPAPK